MPHATYKIAFIGNERQLFHCLRAMTRYGIYAGNNSYPYMFFLFGKFPQEIITDQPFKFQYIGEDRDDMESFIAEDDEEYDLIIDPEMDFHPGGLYSLSQWCEYKMNISPSKRTTPFTAHSMMHILRGTSFRLSMNTMPVGNTIFLMPPSPQDREWDTLSTRSHSWWADTIEMIDKMKYSITYPQIELKNARNPESKFDYRFFFTGFEDSFLNKCYMPVCNSIQDILHHLIHCKIFIGWNNLVADMAAALHIPSIIIHHCDETESKYELKEMYFIRQDEYILRHVHFNSEYKWDHAKLRQALHFVESRFVPFSGPLREYDRLRLIFGEGEAE